MKNLLKGNGALLILLAAVFIFARAFILQGLLPIPADTIIGLYHPYRDLYAADYPNGIPYKNFLITDPVRQIYIWKNLSIDILKNGNLPLWNPYEFSGTPLLANFQSSPFYPLNVILFAKPFEISWSIFVLIQPLLAGLFTYLYLRNFKIHQLAAVFGGIVFAFSGFAVSWMEWGTILSTGLWLPLMLLSVEKLIGVFDLKNQESRIRNQKLAWGILYIFAISSSLLAGHLQTFFYSLIFVFVYFMVRWWQLRKNIRLLFLFIILNSLFLILTAVQWSPTLQFILLSARDSDQSLWQKEGWFLPWQHLVQFVAPDFFGNPATLNYWGTWNYGEMVGYVGIIPLVFALFALLSRLGKRTILFGLALVVSLFFALPNPISKLPFVLDIPFLSTAQPTRLLFITCFSLAILSAFGFDYFIKKHFENNKKAILSKLVFSILIMGILLGTIWVFVLFGKNFVDINPTWNMAVAQKNLLLPSALFGLFAGMVLVNIFVNSRKIKHLIVIFVILFVTLDLIRFANKFDPFVSRNYLFPETKAIEYLQKQPGIFRIASLDSGLLPPNFATQYRLQSISGYDPLFLNSYAQYIVAMERNEPNVNPPYGFNRIVEPKNYNSPLFDLLNVKYVLSLNDIDSPKLTKIFEEGQTKIYENEDVLPRVFFVKRITAQSNPENAIKDLFNQEASSSAVVEMQDQSLVAEYNLGSAMISRYTENEIEIKTENNGNGFLVVSDIYYPTWNATVDGEEWTIYKTNYTFRGIVVPKGKHTIIMKASLL